MKTIINLLFIALPIWGLAQKNHDMRPVKNTMESPNCFVVNLNYDTRRSQEINATGFFISPRHILTNAHVLRHAKNLVAVPGANGLDSERGGLVAPFGLVKISRQQIRLPKGFIFWGWLRKTLKRRHLDYGLIVLPDDSLARKICNCPLPSVPFELLAWAQFPGDSLAVRLAGYASPKKGKATPPIPRRSQWSSSGTIFKKHYSRRRKTLFYKLDSFPGNSGSPVWIDAAHSKKVIALHGYGHLGITIHPRMIADLNAWGVPLRE